MKGELLRPVAISKQMGVSRAVVSNRRNRYADHPEPAEVTHHVELWRWDDVAAFLPHHWKDLQTEILRAASS